LRRRSRLSHGILLGLLAGDERLHGGVRLDEPREERTFVHVVEHGRELQRAGQVFNDFDVGARGEFADQFQIFQDKIAQTVRALLVELVAFHRGEHGAENFRAEDVHEILGALAAEPQEQFAAGGVLVDVTRERFLEQRELALRDEQAGKFLRELCGNMVQRAAQHVLPFAGTIRARDDVSRRGSPPAAGRT